jgi:hypothetical protein
MKYTTPQVVAMVILLAMVGPIAAQQVAAEPPVAKVSAPTVVLPAGITEEMLAPPPVPSFMLKPSATPLTVDEMVQQAREAEQKAGIKQPVKPAN